MLQSFRLLWAMRRCSMQKHFPIRHSDKKLRFRHRRMPLSYHIPSWWRRSGRRQRFPWVSLVHSASFAHESDINFAAQPKNLVFPLPTHSRYKRQMSLYKQKELPIELWKTHSLANSVVENTANISIVTTSRSGCGTTASLFNCRCQLHRLNVVVRAVVVWLRLLRFSETIVAHHV